MSHAFRALVSDPCRTGRPRAAFAGVLALGLLGLAVSACAGGRGEQTAALAAPAGGGPRMVTPARPLQCVPYVRAVSKVAIRGDARTWWRQAEGRYDRRFSKKTFWYALGSWDRNLTDGSGIQDRGDLTTVDFADARAVVCGVGRHAHLPAEQRAGAVAQPVNRHRQQRDGLLLSGGQQHVELA